MPDDVKAEAIASLGAARERVALAEQELDRARAGIREAAVKAKRAGLSMSAIGAELGLSKQRAHELART